MTDSNTQLTVRNNKGNDIETVEESSDWSEAPVIDNTGNAEIRDFDAASDDHPLVEYAGEKAQRTDIQGGGEFVSEEIYENDEKWVREWFQNQETACIRRCKMKVQLSDEYPDGWCQKTIIIDAETGEKVENGDATDDGTVALELPRPNNEIIEAARNLGYDPTIVWDIYRDERKIITEDNGIGMTPKEFWDNFKSPFSSGSGVDGDTGGNFGIGSNSVEKVHGAEGAAQVYTRSSRPGNSGYEAYSYRGGATAIGEPIPDGDYGTVFEIPVCEEFNLSNVQEWVEKYGEKLLVPVLYREHDAGTTPVEEEYEATNFVESYDNPPVVIERPGEFTAVAGPDIIDTGFRSNDADTFLVSMRIDRNTRASINTFWDVVIQIHDEQGRIVSGPNRGYYSNGNYVYLTGQNNEKLCELHEDDIVLPQPTGSRDRLKKTDYATQFFQYVQNEVESEELKEVSDIAKRMQDTDHPADAIRGSKDDWNIFRKMIRYHGSRRVTNSLSRFTTFIDDRDEFPDYDDETKKQIYNLFKEISHCHNGSGRSSRKSSRREKELGQLLASTDPEDVYMAASTGGKFTQRFKVVENTIDDPEIIVINGASKYDKWNSQFGFKVLKEVPLTDTEDDDHDYDVPKAIHESNISKGTSSKSKADKVIDRKLKIRTDSKNSSIDLRMSIGDAKERLENGGKFGEHNKLVLFPQTHNENISDNYEFSEYAAIASVSKKEYDELAGYDEVMTIDEYKEWSKSALITTEDGEMPPADLIEDDRMVILTFRPQGENDILKLLSEEQEQLRQYYCEDIRDQFEWATHLDGYDGGYHGDDIGKVPDSDKRDTLFAVADSTVLKRAEWTFDQLDTSMPEIAGLKLTHSKFGHRNPAYWYSLDQTTTRYRLMADTPNWDDSSDVYDMMPRRRDERKAQMFLGLHDRNIDPSEKEPEELRELIN